ncbi:MAG: HEPN domain-containing protein [Methanosarcinales archaeon]
MGSPKNKFRDFALAYWKTAVHDLERAEDAFIDKAYSYTVFHSQQCVEKNKKALLEMEEVFSRDHDVSDLFTIYILKKEPNPELKV